MTSIEEAYLPLNIDMKSNKLTYLKELYNNIDLNVDIEFEDFDPIILKQQCEIYRKKMESYIHTFQKEQKQIEENSEKIELLNSCKDQLINKCSTENIDESLNQMNIVITDLRSKQKALCESHQYTTACVSRLFRTSTHYSDNDPRRLCPICINNEVDTAVVPCGHTVCSNCILKCDLSHCFICRNGIEKTIKLYYI
jgi:hypothetical protein